MTGMRRKLKWAWIALPNLIWLVACAAGSTADTPADDNSSNDLEDEDPIGRQATIQMPVPVVPTEPAPATGLGNADVEFVQAIRAGDGTWTFNVTVRHADTGWDDYADGWDVLLPDGTVLQLDGESSPFTRLLLHPHENEQPFTRSQSGLTIPDGVEEVTVRAHDIVDGFGGAEVVVTLTADSGSNFEVVQQ